MYKGQNNDIGNNDNIPIIVYIVYLIDEVNNSQLIGNMVINGLFVKISLSPVQ